MKKSNALNPAVASAAQITGTDGRDGSSNQDAAKAYENSPPGASGNVPGAHKPVAGARPDASMMSTSKTDAESGIPDVKPAPPNP